MRRSKANRRRSSTSRWKSRTAKELLLTIATALLFLLVAADPLVADELLPSTTTHVPVAARTIARGAVLTADDIAFEDRVIARGTTIDTTVAPGWVARRLINEGEILRAPAVQAPLAVAANGRLDISYSDGTVTLSLQGRRDACRINPGERILGATR